MQYQQECCILENQHSCHSAVCVIFSKNKMLMLSNLDCGHKIVSYFFASVFALSVFFVFLNDSYIKTYLP